MLNLFPVEETVTKRCSVRNFSDQIVELEKIQALKDMIQEVDNPFGKLVHFHVFDGNEVSREQKIGTYGVIKGARHFIGASILNEPMSFEALGYEFEVIVLYLAHLGLGTCWLGGTFDRSSFVEAMKIDKAAILPIISPFGYEANKKHITEIAMRKLVKADKRKNWNQLFFDGDFKTPLSKQGAESFAFLLEMVRLAPSASNKQPWRIVLDENACHFYEYKEPGYSSYFPYDIQRIDMGIAAAHFDLAAKEKGMSGHFTVDANPMIDQPKHVEYVFSWLMN